MLLIILITILFAGGLLAWLSELVSPRLPRWVALAALVINLAILMVLAPRFAEAGGLWQLGISIPWIPRFGIHFNFAADGLSYLMLLLSALLGLVAVGTAWHEIKMRAGFFYFNLLWVLAGVFGVFTSLDLFLFFFFWEVMLIPMYFVISIWGHENRTYAAIKFFIFTQFSGMLMLLAIVTLAFLHFQQTQELTFDYRRLAANPINSPWSLWLMLGFFIAFAVKLPSVPLHTWLPDAHTQAPTAGSVILAGILLKTGAYGLLRFVVPLFPNAAQEFAPVAMCMGMVSVLYGAAMAFAQTDIKRLIAYSSISHMGFITLGVFAATLGISETALIARQGAVITMIAHGLSSAALFALAGAMQHRLHTREFSRMGGFWQRAPGFGGCALFFCLAALGLPGLANFIGEFLVLLGSFGAAPVITVLAALGMIAAPVYALMVIQKAFHGPIFPGPVPPDLDFREAGIMAGLIILTLYFGFQPQPILDLVAPVLNQLADSATAVAPNLAAIGSVQVQ